MADEVADDDVRNREMQRGGPPSFHSIDKQLAVLSAEQRSFRRDVEKRFDTIERRVDDATSLYATKVDLASIGTRIDKLEDKHDKFAASVSSYGKAIILTFLAAVAGIVFKSGLIH